MTLAKTKDCLVIPRPSRSATRTVTTTRIAASSRWRVAPAILRSRPFGARTRSTPMTRSRASVTRSWTLTWSRASATSTGSRTRLTAARATSASLILGKHTDHRVDCRRDEIVCLLYPRHCFFNFLLCSFVALCLWFGNCLRWVVQLDRSFCKLLSIQQQRRNHSCLFRQLHQRIMLSIRVPTAHTQVLDLYVVVAEEVQQLLRAHRCIQICYHKRPTNLFNTSAVQMTW